MRQDVVNPSISKMGRTDRITVAPGRECLRQQFVKIAPDFGDLLFIEYSISLQISIAIERRDLFASQLLWIRSHRRMKLQVALQRVQLFAAGNEVRSGR